MFEEDVEEFGKPIAKLIRAFPEKPDPNYRYTQDEYRWERRRHVAMMAPGKTYKEYLDDETSTRKNQ